MDAGRLIVIRNRPRPGRNRPRSRWPLRQIVAHHSLASTNSPPLSL
nr:MAG TPA: hypothetical protein [Bacteriophage sp.]